MKPYRVCFLALASLQAASAGASILDFKRLTIDFTNAADVRALATWSEPDKLGVTMEGLGWDGEPAALRDGWIQTTPLAVGLSWRTPYAVSIRVSIHPPPSSIVLNSGQTNIPYAGDVYARYSPDLQHWSTWQVLGTGEPQTLEEKQNPGRLFSGDLRVPDSEREEYNRLLSEYARLDVPWKSDEDAAVRWILQKDPGFFARRLPFIGYVQFRYEGGFHGGQRIKSLRADVSYGMGGIHSPPRDPEIYKNRDGRPWSFQAAPAGEKTSARREGEKR